MNLHGELAYDMVEDMVDGNSLETVRKYFPETWIWDIVPVK